MPEELRTRVAAAISSLANGPGATLDAVSEQPDLVSLECVVAQAAESGRSTAPLGEAAHVVIAFLEEAADSLEQDPTATTVPNHAKAARAALSLKPELVGRPYQAVKGRRGRQATIAEWLGGTKENLDNERQDGTTALSDLLLPVAQHLVRRESAYLVEARRRAQRARRPPLESAMRVEWLKRFERYYKIWAPVGGLRHDLEIAVDALRHDNDAKADVYIRKSLYHYSGFLVERRSFVSAHGGQWILPDTRTEDAIADAMWFIREPGPFGEISESALHMLYMHTPELAIFIHETFANQQMRPFVDSWREWVQSCRCKRLKQPRNDCKVHATVRWAQFYMEAVDKQWDFLSDWYDLPRPGTKIDPVRQARRGLPTLPPPLPMDNPAQKR